MSRLWPWYRLRAARRWAKRQEREAGPLMGPRVRLLDADSGAEVSRWDLPPSASSLSLGADVAMEVGREYRIEVLLPEPHSWPLVAPPSEFDLRYQPLPPTDDEKRPAAQ